MLGITNEEKGKFARIICHNNDNSVIQEVNQLTQQQKKKLLAIYAQKIAFQTVNEPVNAPQPDQVAVDHKKNNITGGAFETLFCCFYPQSQRDKFDVQSTTFMKRVLGTFLFFKSNWTEIGGDHVQLYGWLWLNITYIVTLAVAANLNQYFTLPQNYVFSTFFLVKAAGVDLLFSLALPFAYGAIIRCLGGQIPYMLSVSLYGYSLALYLLPTAACLIPSQLWHIIMLILAGALKLVFLFRNYSSKIDARSIIILAVIAIFEALYFLIVIQVFFRTNAGTSITEGTDKVFTHSHHFRLRQL